MKGCELSKWVLNYINNLSDAKAINLIAASKSGNADIIACIKGRYYELEVKGDGDKQTPAQTAKLNKTIMAGGVAGYVECKEDLYNLLALVNKTDIQLIDSDVTKITL